MALNQKRFRRRRLIRKRTSVGLNLTAMMDMFTIILVFLLKSYSVSNVGLKPPAGVELPASSSQEAPKRFLAVDIAANGVFIEQKKVETLDQFQVTQAKSKGDVLKIMYNLVKTQVDQGEIQSTVAVIRAHKDAPFTILWEGYVYFAQAGFRRISKSRRSR